MRLDEAERLHLFNLARAARPRRPQRRGPGVRVRPRIERLLESMTSTPPGTPSEDALKLLASWAATTHDEQPLPDAEQTGKPVP